MDFFNGNVCILFEMSLKFVPTCAIKNIPALVQIMALRQATSHYMNPWWLVCWRIYASLGLKEFMTLQIVTSFRKDTLWSIPTICNCYRVPYMKCFQFARVAHSLTPSDMQGIFSRLTIELLQPDYFERTISRPWLPIPRHIVPPCNS